MCRAVINSNNSTLIYGTSAAMKQQWVSRIEQLLEITVDPDISPYMCKMCKNRIIQLETAVLDLVAFQKLSELSRQALMRISGPVKRTKETSGDIGVSPETARQRPSSKRSRKKLVFQCKCLKG